MYEHAENKILYYNLLVMHACYYDNKKIPWLILSKYKVLVKKRYR